MFLCKYCYENVQISFCLAHHVHLESFTLQSHQSSFCFREQHYQLMILEIIFVIYCHYKLYLWQLFLIVQYKECS